MFRGRYFHTLDPKGRLSVPVKYRDTLQAGSNGTLVLVPNEVCLEVHPLGEWERIEEKLAERSLFDSRLRKAQRLYMSLAKETVLDGAGRILIPPDVRERAGLSRDVTLVGGSRRFFEVWDRHRFEEFERSSQGELPSVFQRLARLGV